jgi:hypothetical protein
MKSLRCNYKYIFILGIILGLSAACDPFGDLDFSGASIMGGGNYNFGEFNKSYCIPVNIFADSVIVGSSKDSITMYGHIKGDQELVTDWCEKNYIVVDKFIFMTDFLVKGSWEHTIKIENNFFWEFNNLDTVIMAKAKVPYKGFRTDSYLYYSSNNGTCINPRTFTFCFYESIGKSSLCARSKQF